MKLILENYISKIINISSDYAKKKIIRLLFFKKYLWNIYIQHDEYNKPQIQILRLYYKTFYIWDINDIYWTKYKYHLDYDILLINLIIKTFGKLLHNYRFVEQAMFTNSEVLKN